MGCRNLGWCVVVLGIVSLSACSSLDGISAPVSERAVSQPKPLKAALRAPRDDKKGHAAQEQDLRPQVYVVQKGDTLYSIALNNGLDYREIAQLNNLQDPGVIKVGQELHLFADKSAATLPPVQSPVVTSQPLAEIPFMEQPKAVKLPYSEQAVADIKVLQDAPPKVEVAAKPQAKNEIQAKNDLKSEPQPQAKDASNDDADIVEWGTPTQGKVLSGFSESANRKGIDVAGNVGQPVLASAAGKVVYSGSGLRGYGKLVIIKHNKTFLSAYAHNDQILVKEGQIVNKGQKIAEMGSTDSDQVKLHFEIRKFGKPVDPSKYLPIKS